MDNTPTNYSMITQVNKLQNTDKWSDFMQRMANYIVSQPPLSQLAHENVDELNSEIGICPCGQGFVIDSLHDVDSFYYPTYGEPIIACDRCSHEFTAQDVEYKNVTMADEQDRTIKLINNSDNNIIFNAIIYPMFLWKLISNNGIIE